MRILFIGIGEMGVGMAENILQKNGALDIWNRTPDKPHVRHLVARGAAFVADLAAAAKEADFICFNLTSELAVGSVAADIAGHVKPGTILMDFSTISPDAVVAIARDFAARGAFFLDCPVSGGSTGAKAGTLAMMVGGDRTAFEKALPVLEMCGNNIRYMGASGLGQKTKLINQLLTWTNQAVVCEAMLLAEKSGIDLANLHSVLKTALARSWVFEHSVEQHIIPRDFDSPSGIELMVKDFGLIAKMADRAGCAIPFASQAKALYDQALSEGLIKKAPAVILEVMERDLKK